MRRIKKFTSLLLAFAMVLSLLMLPTNAVSVNAADDFVIDLATTGYNMLKPGSKVQETTIKKMTVGTTTVTYTNLEVVFNNGTYNLDPDDRVDEGVNYGITLSFDVSNPDIIKGISSVKINTNAATFDSSLSDYVKGSVSVNDKTVTIKANIAAYPVEIGIEEIAKLRWELINGSTVNSSATLLDSVNIHYSSSAISWYYSADSGKTRSRVTKVDKEADGGKTMYIAEVTLHAKSGYCFKEYTKEELEALKAYEINYSVAYPTAKSRKDITLTIKGIKPIESVATDDNALTEINFDTVREIKATTGLTATAIRYMLPNNITYRIGNGTRSTVFFDLSKWEIRDTNKSLVSDSQQITAGKSYYACMSLTTVFNLIKARNSKVQDTHGLLNAYKADKNPYLVPDTLTQYFRDNYYWVIKIDALSTDAGITSSDIPEFTFDKTGMKYNVTTAVGTIAGTAATGWTGTGSSTTAIAPMHYAADNSNTVSGNAIITGGQIYVAWGKGNTRLASPVSYRYYNTTTIEATSVSGKNITITMQTPPKAGEPVYKSLVKGIKGYDINGDAELMQALDFSRVWSFYTANKGAFIYDNGVTKFDELTSYGINIYIPIKEGYTVYNNDATISFGTGGSVTGYAVPEGNFLHINAWLNYTDRVGFINNTGVKKKMYFDGFNAPVGGEAVPKKVELTPSSAKYAQFMAIQWREDGKPFSGSTFTAGKKYEATLILNASKGWITTDYGNAGYLVGDITNVRSAVASAANQSITIEYYFGVCPTKSVKSVGNVAINVENGTSADAFKNKLNEKHVVKVTYSDKSTEEIEVKPGFKSGTTRYGSFYEQFTAQYPGDKGYKPENEKEQEYIIYGTIDLSAYNASERYEVKIIIKVSEGLVTVTFDAYGGVYLGEKTMKVKKNGPYGFSYDPAKIYREGYFFAGWYLVPGDNYDAENRVWAKSICTSDVTLYAHWLKTFTGIVWEVSASSHSKGSITVKWDNIKTLYNGFEVEISRDGIIWSEPENVGKAKTKYYTGLESGKYYYVRVRAYRYDSAGKIVYGSWNNKLTKVKVK